MAKYSYLPTYSLPSAISITELIEQPKQRKPDITTLSEEWVWLKLMPQNPYMTKALRYTQQFPIKYMVQRRQMRSDHPHSKYIFRIFQYLKELAIEFCYNITIVCAEDKAVIPVGEPMPYHLVREHKINHLRKMATLSLVL